MIEETNPPCVPVAVIVGLAAVGEPVVWDRCGRRARLLRQVSSAGTQDVTPHQQVR